jgi:hypothetical protein
MEATPLLFLLAAPLFAQLRVTGLEKHGVTLTPIAPHTVTVHNQSGKDVMAVQLVWTFESGGPYFFTLIDALECVRPVLPDGKSLTVEFEGSDPNLVRDKTVPGTWYESRSSNTRRPIAVDLVAVWVDGTVAGPDTPQHGLRDQLRQKWSKERPARAAHCPRGLLEIDPTTAPTPLVTSPKVYYFDSFYCFTQGQKWGCPVAGYEPCPVGTACALSMSFVGQCHSTPPLVNPQLWFLSMVMSNKCPFATISTGDAKRQDDTIAEGGFTDAIIRDDENELMNSGFSYGYCDGTANKSPAPFTQPCGPITP